MGRFKFILLQGLILFFSSMAAACTPVFLFGGGHRDPGALKQLKNSVQNPAALIITWSTSQPSETFLSLSTDLKSVGIEKIEQSVLVQDTDSLNEFLKQAPQANIIFFSGGDQNKALDIIDQFHLQEFLQALHHQGVVFAGTSAGTALMPAIAMTGEADLSVIQKNNTKIRAGLGLVRQLVDQHFIVRGRFNRLASLVLDYPRNIGLGVDENSAIKIHDHKIQTYGPTPLTLIHIRQKDQRLVSELINPGETIDLRSQRAMEKIGAINTGIQEIPVSYAPPKKSFVYRIDQPL